MGTIFIRGAKVFDGQASIGVRDVLVAGGRIEKIAPNLEPPADASVIDGANRTLLPGLFDCHVHVFADALVDTLPFGVTTVLDMFTDVATAASLRQEQRSGPVHHRAHLLSAGNLATAPGGHGTQYGVKVETLSSPDEADGFVRRRIDEGSDYIKIIWEPGDGTWPTLDEPTISAVVEAAHQYDKLAVIHVTRYAHARRAIELGVDGLAHIFGDRDPEADFAELVASRGVFVVPTLSVRAGSAGIASGAPLLERPPFADLLTPQQRGSLLGPSGWLPAETFTHAMNAVRSLHAHGVKILAGTDAPNPGTAHGASLHREIQLLAECGMSPTEALASATSAPAEVFSVTGRGRIIEGAIADLLLVDGDPTNA